MMGQTTTMMTMMVVHSMAITIMLVSQTTRKHPSQIDSDSGEQVVATGQAIARKVTGCSEPILINSLSIAE
jgi:hypothetical protein